MPSIQWHFILPVTYHAIWIIKREKIIIWFHYWITVPPQYFYLRDCSNIWISAYIFWDFRWHLIVKPFELVVFIWGLKSFDISVRRVFLSHPQIVSYGSQRTLNQVTNELLPGLSHFLFLLLPSSLLFPLLLLLLTIYNTQSPPCLLFVSISHFLLLPADFYLFIYLFRSAVWYIVATVSAETLCFLNMCTVLWTYLFLMRLFDGLMLLYFTQWTVWAHTISHNPKLFH